MLIILIITQSSQCSQEEGAFEKFEKPKHTGNQSMNSIDPSSVKMVGPVKTKMQCSAKCHQLPYEECNAFEVRGNNQQLCILYTLDKCHFKELDLSQVFIRPKPTRGNDKFVALVAVRANSLSQYGLFHYEATNLTLQLDKTHKDVILGQTTTGESLLGQTMPIVCRITCYTYDPCGHTRALFTNLKFKPWRSIVTSNSEMLVLSSTKTKFVNADGTVRVGPKVPQTIHAPCVVKFDENTAFLTGGHLDSNSRNTLVLDIPSQKWSLDGPKMTVGRYQHACGFVLDTQDLKTRYCLVIGGKGTKGVSIKSTEILIPGGSQNMKWSNGPSLQQVLTHAGAATSPDKLRLFVFGGKHGNGRLSRTILSFQCSKKTCKWDKLEARLKTGGEVTMAFFVKHDCN